MSHPVIDAIYITCYKVVGNLRVGSLRELQHIVDGLIEPVTLSDGSTMYVNEDGIGLGLRFNSIATDVAGLGGRLDLLLQGVRGDVVIVGPLNKKGYDTDVTEQARKWVEAVKAEA